jgi:uncharacterized membrane-anchored protein
MNKEDQQEIFSKVPAVTFVFWVIKILATTLGETGGDTLSMSMNLGYLLSTGIFSVIFVAAVIIQVRAKKFHPVIYWATIVATTTVGTTLADFADRSLGIGYAGGTTILLVMLMASLWIWKRNLGSVAVDTVNSPKSEMYYWVTIMCSQTLGTALSINQNQHRRILRRLHHILKLPVSRDWFFEFGGNCRHGFEEAQQKTALDRVIHILRQRPARRQRRPRIQLGW